jgi:hypothetical protein
MQYRCLIRGRNCLPFANTWFHRWFCSRICVAHLFSFLCCVVFFVLFICLRTVSCVHNVASISGLSILDFPSVFLCLFSKPTNFYDKKKKFEYAKSSNSKDRQCNVTKYKKTNNARQNMTQKT